MRVEILGTRGHIEVSAPQHELHAGVLVDDVLFDVGERQYLDRKPRAVFLTHLHEDHAFFVDDREVELDAPIYSPQSWDGRGWHIVRSTVDIDDMRVTPVPTNHSAALRSCGYLIEKDLARIFYTGDLISVQERYRDRLPDLDLVIADGSFIRRGGLVRRDPETGRPHGHTGIPDLVEFFSALTPRIVFTHFGSWFFHDLPGSIAKIEALGEPGKVQAAWDGMVLDIGP